MEKYLPKIWRGRIKKYWDKTLPGFIPASKSKFSLKFDTEEEKEAVEEFEAALGTEESVVTELLPEGMFMSGYLGVYDVKGPRDELILLSPEKVDSKDNFMVLHYENEEWQVVEDVQLIDGYIWGTVPSFVDGEASGMTEDEEELSPVAVVFYKKDIEVVQLDYFKDKVGVANGNPVQIIMNDNNEVVARSLASGKEINLTEEEAMTFFGGTSDNIDLDTTSVSVDRVNCSALRVYAGSIYYDENYDNTYVKEANVTVTNSHVGGISCSYGMVRTELFNMTVENSIAMFTASGQTTISKLNKDANISLQRISMASASWVKKAIHNISNSEVQWLYTGGSSGYSYTVDAECNISNTNITGGISAGGSNGKSDNVVFNIDNVVAPNYSNVNRGIIGNTKTKIKSSKIDEVAVFGGSDEDINGTITGNISIDMNDGIYTIIAGKNGGEAVTDASQVEFVKVSRAADYTISDADLAVLGDKFIVK